MGFTCCNDVTCRDLQIHDNQWTRCKGFDTFAPLGPVVVSGLDIADLKIKSVLNGKIMQDSSTKNMINNPYKIVSYISSIMTLLPEDVITCGTPGGIGPMQKGDKIEIFIEKIGSLINYVR